MSRFSGSRADGVVVALSTVLRYEDAESPHVRIVGREEHADVAGNARDNHGAHVELLQQHVESRAEKRRVHRLKHEVVVGVRAEQAGDLAARHVLGRAVLDQAAEVGAPAAEVVVDVDRRHSGPGGSRLQASDPPRHREGLAREAVGARKLHVVDHVDE
jgi:hypothetical protein